MSDSVNVLHRGGCHCGAVSFELEAPSAVSVLDCNCSICAMVAYLHLIVPQTQFRLLSGADHLSDYRFQSGVAKHYFCRVCGIKSFYVPRSHPDQISVSVRALRPGTVTAMTVIPYDGQNWEEARRALGADPH